MPYAKQVFYTECSGPGSDPYAIYTGRKSSRLDAAEHSRIQAHYRMIRANWESDPASFTSSSPVTLPVTSWP